MGTERDLRFEGNDRLRLGKDRVLEWRPRIVHRKKNHRLKKYDRVKKCTDQRLKIMPHGIPKRTTYL